MVKKRWKILLGMTIVVLAIVGMVVPAAMADEDNETVSTPPLSVDGSWREPGLCGGVTVGNDVLAEALGITEEELQTAQDEARAAGIQQAVDEGLITQEQADRMLACGGFGFRGWGGPGGNIVDQRALLADALGISVDELQAAQDQAFAARLSQAVEAGCITQEEADMMIARRDLTNYLNTDEIKNAIRSIYENAVQQAVADGVITQEQADTFLSEGVSGFGGPGIFDGHGRMRGGPGRFGPCGS